MGLPNLLLDVLLLRALGLVDPEGLALVVVATVFLGEELGRLLDERKIDPDPLVLDVHVHRLLDDLLLEAFLQAFGFSSGRQLAGRTVYAFTTLELDHLRDVQLVLQTLELRQGDGRLHAVQVFAVVQAVVGKDIGRCGIIGGCLAEERGIG